MLRFAVVTALVAAAPWLAPACSGEVHSPGGGDDAIADVPIGDNGNPGDTAADNAGPGDSNPGDPGGDVGGDNGVGDPGSDATSGDTAPNDAGPDWGPEIVEPPTDAWDPLCESMGEFVDPNCYSQASLFYCAPDAPPASSPARIRRIGRNEITRASGHRTSSELGQNPFDAPATLPFSTYDAGVTVDATTLDLFLNVIDRPGQGWTARDAGIRIRHTYDGDPYKCMWNTPDQACKDLWLNGFLEDGMLFRSPTAEEYADLAALLDQALADEATNGLTRQETLRNVVSAAWLDPGALFRVEMGEDAADADGRHRLTDWELGKALSYLVGERGPGATASFHFGAGPGGSGWTTGAEGYFGDIEAAVKDGSIQDTAVITQLVKNNAGGIDPERNDMNVENKLDESRTYRGDYFLAPKVAGFFREWLGYGGFANTFHDTPQATSQWDWDGLDPTTLPDWRSNGPGVSYGNLKSQTYGDEPTGVQQLDDMIARIVVEDVDVFDKLLTSRTFYLPATNPVQSEAGTQFMALAYNVYDNDGQTDANRWTDLPNDERAGVLTHPVFLASHADAFEDGPSIIHRGKWMRENLMCQYIPPLTKVEGIEAMLNPEAPGKSARRRIEEDIEPRPECMFCHVRMNALGKPFEMYNHAGFLRYWDRDETAPNNQGPVDGSTTLADEVVAGTSAALPDPGLHGDYDSPVALMEALAQSDAIKQCFIRQAFRYFMGRPEGLADACTLAQMEQAYDVNGSFFDMLAALATSDTFLYRVQDDAAVCE